MTDQDHSSKCACQPVINGFVCNNLSQTDLQNIQSRHNLAFQVDRTPASNKIHFQTNQGTDTATAIRVSNSDIRLYTSHNYCEK